MLMWSRAGLLALLGSGQCWAHSKGFHKRDVVTVNASGVEVLVALDIDSGTRCELLRRGADADADGALSDSELMALKDRLASVAAKSLKVTVSGYSTAMRVVESKLDVRGERRVSPEALSVAVLLTAWFPEAASSGLLLVLEDTSPDRSHVAVEVHQETAADSGEEPVARRELLPGKALTVRLGHLAAGAKLR